MVQFTRGLKRFIIARMLSFSLLRRISDGARLYILCSSESQYCSGRIPAAIEDYVEVARVAISLVVRARCTAPLGACDGHSQASERGRGGKQQFNSIGKQPHRWRSMRIVPCWS
jgi:hypothetical protein